MGERMTGAELDAAEALANAATEGPWDAEIGEDIQVNAGTARTVWNEAGTVGTPAGSWRTTDRILEYSDAEYELEEDDYEQIAATAEFIAAARSLVPRLVAEVRARDTVIEAVRAIEVADRVDHFGHVGEDGEPCGVPVSWKSRMGRELAAALEGVNES